MNLTTLAALLREDMTTIKVRFANSRPNEDPGQFGDKLYTYKCKRELADQLAIDNVVVVHAKIDANPCEVQTARVVEIHDHPQLDIEDKREYKWAIAKVDVQTAHTLQAQDIEIGKQLNSRKQLSCRNQALAALGLSPEDAKQLFAPKEDKDS